MTEERELELTNEELVQICEFAERVEEGREEADPEILAFVLKGVALCLHHLQAGEPPMSGPGVDEWYDKDIGQNVRVMWMKVKPFPKKLKDLGIL